MGDKQSLRHYQGASCILLISFLALSWAAAGDANLDNGWLHYSKNATGLSVKVPPPRTCNVGWSVATCSQYRKLVIEDVDFVVNSREIPLRNNLRFYINYIKPDADRKGPYRNGQTMCLSNYTQVSSLPTLHYVAKFNFKCKTSLVHKDATIKFVVEEDSPTALERLSFEGQDKLRNLKSGSIKLKLKNAKRFGSLGYKIQVLESKG